MVKIALDPAMYHADLSVPDELRNAADLGYEYLELSPRADLFFWHRYPKADDAAVAAVKKACNETGVTLLSLVPVFNWSSPDEQERQAQVRNWRRLQIVRELNKPWVNDVFCGPHAFHLSDGAGDLARMMRYAGDKMAHLHIADCYNHRANVGNRYIINPPGVDARIHQHNEIGNGDIAWDELFSTLREVSFDGIATVCVFGWEENADEIHRRMLERLTSELRP
jgi:sugar phosphate isomerase/epimerase